MSLEKWRAKYELDRPVTERTDYPAIIGGAALGGVGAGIGDAMAESKFRNTIRLEPLDPQAVARRVEVNKMLKAMGRNKELLDESKYAFKYGAPVSKRLKYGGIGGLAGTTLGYVLARMAMQKGDEE